MDCGKKFLYLQKKVEHSYFFAFVPTYCKSWSCPKCRLIKSAIVKKYVKDNFTTDNLYMLTLTFYHSGNAIDAWKKIGDCWNRSRTYIAKMSGRFDYLRIVEPHKKGGWPHLHVLIKGCNINQGILKKITDWGFGWNAQVERISTTVAAHYVSKYLSKPWDSVDADIMRQSTNTRIVCVSRGMPPIFTKKSEWEIVKYDCPEEHATFMHSVLVAYLMTRGASYVLSKQHGPGFIIESDIHVNVGVIDGFVDPYAWKVSETYDYEWLPFGKQMKLIFERGAKLAT